MGGDGLLRARFAALTLIGASGAQLLASGAAALGRYELAVLVAVLGTLAWLPALHGLEHFLKRRSEALSLAALAAGTLGVIAIVCASARASAEAPGAAAAWSWTWILAARVLLPVSLAVFGAALATHRLLPVGAAAALGAGSLVQALSWMRLLSLPPALDQALVFSGATWLGLRLLLDPEGWRRGTP
ncbi:MAG TPA: hypothetical protein VFD43_04900 [Planctomycetota bacterium]|nr:hypothetical protein [Planctomycetota bacterium]